MSRTEQELEDVIFDLMGRLELSEEDVRTLREAEEELERLEQ